MDSDFSYVSNLWTHMQCLRRACVRGSWFWMIFFSVQRTRILKSFKQFKSMAMYLAIIKPNQNTISYGLSFWEKKYLSTKILRNDPGFFLNLLVYMNPGKYFNFGHASVHGGRYLWSIINRILLLMKRQYTNKDSILNKQTCFWTLFGYLVAWCTCVCVCVCVWDQVSPFKTWGALFYIMFQ